VIQDYLFENASRLPDKEALVVGERRWTYADLAAAARRIASHLGKRGYDGGFRAGILTDDPFDYITAYFGILAAGGVVVGINTQTSVRALSHVLRDCGVATLLTHKKFGKWLADAAAQAPLLEEIVVRGGVGASVGRGGGHRWIGYEELGGSEPGESPGGSGGENPSELAQIIYTSGTTGEPKGVMLRHANLMAVTNSIVTYLELSESDRMMVVLPFFYSYGNSLLLTHFAVGGTLVVNQNFLYPNAILDQMVREGVTGFSGVPTTFAILLHRSAIRDYSFPSLRYVTQAGGAMSPRHLSALREILPSVKIFIMYGQTEASTRLSFLPPEDLDRKPGSIGKAIPGVTLEVLRPDGTPVAPGEVGEIVAQGGNIMAGYWNRPEETAKVLKGGRLWTGDLARLDDEGYLYIVARKSEMIKSGAHRIAPKEIEDVILEHDAVHECVVLGVPDEILGEAIRACVVLKPREDCNEKIIVRHCRRLLPAYKVPHQVRFHDALPKTSSGKIMKRQLVA